MIRTLLIALTVSAVASGCGGGGGGGGESTAADVSLSVDHDSVDTGERITVYTHISDVGPMGVELKYRFPVGLEYVAHSAYLTVDNWTLDVGPTTDGVYKEHNYLVFFFPQDLFGDNIEGELRFTLDAVAATRGDNVAVDADLDDPALPNDEEFSARDPNFSEEAECGVKVTDGDEDPAEEEETDGEESEDEA